MKNTLKFYFAIVFVFCSIQLKAQSSVPTQGLMAYYPFSGNANDASGNGNHGTNSNAALTAGRHGDPNEAYAFNGTNSYILLNNNFDYQNRTLSIWFKADTVTSDWSVIYTSDNMNIMYGMLTLSVFRLNNQDRILYNLGNKLDTAVIQQKKWHHTVVSIHNDTASVYLDCQFIGKTHITGYLNSNDVSTKAVLGTSRGLNMRFFKGAIDDLRIYNRGLDTSEIGQLCRESNPSNLTSKTRYSAFEVFPNPAYGSFTIRFPSIHLYQNLKAVIYTSDGKKLFDLDIDEAETTLNNSEFRNGGMYFIYLYDRTGQISQVEKLIYYK